MKIDRGVAYCGLACCVCGENSTCVGCRSEGCKDKDWCKNFNCCRQKGLNGCWECGEFPCEGGMLQKVRIRAFARFINEHGEDDLVACLASNEEAGIAYHYKGELVGDYDQCDTEEAIMQMIKNGK